jgi:TPR repeat protein
MKSNKLVKGYLRAAGLFAMACLLGGAVLVWPSGTAAQEKVGASAGKKCWPANLASLIELHGGSVRVGSALSSEQQVDAVQQYAEQSAPGSTSRMARSMKVARKILEKTARQGDPRAQVDLAVLVLAGWGGNAKSSEALRWFRAAAAQGYSRAQYDLGILYFEGCGVGQDYNAAFHFFEKAALGGDAIAQLNLGYMYDRGIAVAHDPIAASAWYRKAAERGEAHAQFNLGDLLLRGEGVPLDEAVAFIWFEKAALQGHTQARIMLGSMYAAGRGTPKDLMSGYAWIAAAVMQGDRRGDSWLMSIERQLNPKQLAEAKERAQSLAQSSPRLSELASLR